MNILVTGATGFLGISLCAQLEAQGHDIVRLNSKNADLTRDGSLNQFNEHMFDHIYHLAAWTQAGDFCLRHPGDQWVINQKINTNVLTWWQARQPGAKLVCMGTSCSYDPSLPLSEGNYLAGTPIESLYTYAMTKRMLYVGLLALRKQYGLNYLCLVPSTLYGPGYHDDGRQMHFIFDLIRKILRGKELGGPVTLWGDGHQKRELVYVEDFVRILLSLSDMVDNDLVNIGAGEEFPIRHFARVICERVEYDYETICYDTSRYVGARSKCLEIEKLKTLMTDLQFTPLEMGLEKTIAWFREDRKRFMGV
jgi:GDP-L-fucose synthase